MTNQSLKLPIHTAEQVITIIRETRNALLNSLLNDASLLAFAEEHFNTIALSSIKLEFLKRDLKELHEAPLDLVHYAAMLQKSKDHGLMISSHHPLILTEIFTIFAKHGINKP